MIQYQVAMPQPTSHLFEVTMRVPAPPQPTMDLVLPAWTPGSYKIRDFARHVHRFNADRSFEKVDKN
ncbi:MAG: M61 family metallopeptidase, partial [Candidatus Xenobia bacterium]